MVTLKLVPDWLMPEMRGTEVGSKGLVPAMLSMRFEAPSPSASPFGARPLSP
jgi:hypothetical protein